MRAPAFLIIIFCTCCCMLQSAAAPAKGDSTVYVDKNGVMRWKNSNEEVHGFGINYTVPFAYGYRSAKQLGIDIEAAIDADVYHFARLGFDAYRVHVWDTEISDTLGNLLDNDHLRLFDYALWKMKQRGMYFLITPIAYWGNGWPEPDTKTPGFSARYGKDKSLTDTGAIKAQQRYLYQFLNHVNRYTGVAYKDEPNIVAFEVSNEPHHGEAAEKVTAFIKGMLASMRSTGCSKPLFYNISHRINLEPAYFNAGISGGTFQWYPTGLGFKQELQGNLLPNVDDYPIPFAQDAGFKKIAKLVYEFDAADVGRSYIYPAMARSFRSAGIQWATHFAYDPTYTAWANTEYDTHFMNLVYAPQKALGLMIAGEVFHRVPLYKNYEAYPADTSFDGFRVSYKNDLAELITPEKFIYTNSTASRPLPANLQAVAGCGNSPVVQYNGTGAYFLDKVKEGAWRLEVMPDAIWVNDPFGRNSLKKINAVINWRQNEMKVNLPGLGNDFSIVGFNIGNTYNAIATDGNFTVMPGTYMLFAKNTTNSFTGTEMVHHLHLSEFAAPAATVNKTYVIHHPLSVVNAGDSVPVAAVVASPYQTDAVELFVMNGYRSRHIPMKAADGYHYNAVIPADLNSAGLLRYYIVVKQNDSTFTYPSGSNTSPVDWDFYDDNAYTTPVVNSSSPVYLFNAFNDAGSIIKKWLPSSAVVMGDKPNTALLNVNVPKLYEPDIENPGAEKIPDYSMRFVFVNKISGRKNSVAQKHTLIFRGNALNKRPCVIQLALVTKDGNAFGAVMNIDTALSDYPVPLAALKPVNTVLLPRPYPSFLPYYFRHSDIGFNIDDIESLQVSVGPGIEAKEQLQPNGIAIESVRLE